MTGGLSELKLALVPFFDAKGIRHLQVRRCPLEDLHSEVLQFVGQHSEGSQLGNGQIQPRQVLRAGKGMRRVQGPGEGNLPGLQ
jgi:hypothetical protein